MARQRIGFWEMNFDKMLLGLAATGLLGVVAWQLAGAQNTVKVGSQEGVAPGEAWSKVKSMADSLQSKLNAQSVEPPTVPPMNLLETFRTKAARSVAPVPELRFAQAIPAVEALSAVAINNVPKGARVVMAPLPSLSRPLAYAFMSTVDPGEVQAAIAADPRAASVLPKDAPMDVAAVSVQVTLDGAALRAALERDLDGPGTGNEPAPRTWWDQMQVLGVDLLRERLVASPRACPRCPGA